MSRTTNGSKACAIGGASSANSATTRVASGCNRRARAPATFRAAGGMARRRCSEQTGEVIEKRQRHHDSEHGHADSLADLEGAVGNGTALDEFREIIQQMPAIQQRNRQQVEHAETDADQREIANEDEQARL